MEAADTRKVTPDERRGHILDIAHAAFIRDGYSGTSMARIAALLGGSKTTLYNYFESKKDLFVAMADRECAKLFDQIFVATEIPGDFRDRVHELARRLMGSMLSDDMIDAYRLIVAEAGRFPEIGHAMHDIALRRGTQHLAVFFKRAMDAGEMREVNPKMPAEQFLDLCSGVLHKLRLWNVVQTIPPERLAMEADRITSTFLAAFGSEDISRAARGYSGY
jgi:AcrR family transcriptional regulator